MTTPLDEAIDVWHRADRAEQALADRLRRAGWGHLSARWLPILRAIADEPGITPGRLRRASNVTYALQRMQGHGLLTIGASSFDLRVRPLELTPSGHALLAALEEDA